MVSDPNLHEQAEVVQRLEVVVVPVVYEVDDTWELCALRQDVIAASCSFVELHLSYLNLVISGLAYPT